MNRDKVFLGFLIAILGAPFFAIYGQWYGYQPELHTTSYLVVLLPVLIAVYFALLKQNDTVYWAVNFKWILAFYGWLTISVIWALNFYEYLYEWLQWSNAIVAAMLIYQFLTHKKQVIILLQALAICCSITVWLGLLQYFGIERWILDGSPPSATFFNKNIANQFVICSFPALVASIMLTTHYKFKQFFRVTFVAVIVYVLYTGTRAATLALIIQLLVLTVLVFIHFKEHFSRSKIIKFIAIVFTVVAVTQLFNSSGFDTSTLAKNYLGDRQDVNYSTIDRITTDSGRLPLLVNTFAMIKQHWFQGVGLGNWQIYYPLYHNHYIEDKRFSMFASPTNTHNDFLQYSSELGIIGVILLIMALADCLKRAVLKIATPNELVQKVVALSVILFTIGFFVEANLSFPLQMPMPKVLLLIWIIISARLSGQLRTKDVDVIQNTTLMKVVALVFLLTSVLAFSWQQNWYKAEVTHRKANADKKFGRPEQMIRHAIESYSFNPLRYRLLYLAANGMLQKGEPGRALQYYKAILKGYPYMLAAKYQYSIALSQLQKHREASEVLEQYIQLDSRTAAAYKALGVLYINHLEQPLKAIKPFQKALDLDPNITDAKEIRRFLKSVANSQPQ